MSLASHDGSPNRLILELRLDAHDASRLAEGLAGIPVPATMKGQQLIFSDEDFGGRCVHWIVRLEKTNRAIHAAARRAGKPLARYKPYDEVELILAVCEGLQGQGLSSLVHALIWRQPFPNANHRTAVAAVLEAHDLRPTEAQLVQHLTPLFEESKALMTGHGTSLSDDEAKRRHQEIAVAIVDVVQSIK